jgi:hypothetical protein
VIVPVLELVVVFAATE